MKHVIISLALALSAACPANAQQHVMDINTKKVGAPVQKTMYGLFFEDINFAADGGLYAEKILNRSFEFPNPLQGWKTCGKVTVRNDGPFERCPHYLRLDPPGHGARTTLIENRGSFGIGVKQNETYRISLWARCPNGGESKLKVALFDESTMESAQIFSKAEISVSGSEWQKYSVEIVSAKTLEKAAFRLYGDSKTTTDVEHVSMFPKDTYNGHENGLRRDLCEALADTKPGVFRFPGGCIVEGADLPTRYQWKNTVGPVENRPLNENRWQICTSDRVFPDYNQSYGLGFYEYFLLAEEMGAEPLPVLNCGMACQFQNKGDEQNAHGDELEQYIQDCIDLVEFANGSTDTKWGKVRAEMGHPAPFNMKLLGVGNEQWDSIYYNRLAKFMPRLRKACPGIKIVGTCGPSADGKKFETGWQAMRDQKVDLVDEHFYRNEEWFLSQGTRYDNYDRKGPKVFAGEYACHGKGKKWNHYGAAIYEAAMMTGFERNADVVYMTAYAPLFAHVEGWQWRPDLIWFNNNNMFKSSSYYVQQMFGNNKGTNMLKLTMDNKCVSGLEGQDGLYASSVYEKATNSVLIKVVNTSDEAQDISVNLQGMKGERTAEVLTLCHDGLDDENSIEQPEKIKPTATVLTLEKGAKSTVLKDKLQPMSFKVYKIKK